jgi:hypothetical protein
MQVITVLKSEADGAQIMDAILEAYPGAFAAANPSDPPRVESTATQIVAYVADGVDAAAIEAIIVAHETGASSDPVGTAQAKAKVLRAKADRSADEDTELLEAVVDSLNIE